MSPGVNDGNWEYGIDCLGRLSLDLASIGMWVCYAIVPFPVVNNETLSSRNSWADESGIVAPNGLPGGPNWTTAPPGGLVNGRSAIKNRPGTQTFPGLFLISITQRWPAPLER